MKKLKVIQVGSTHEHAIGKFVSVNKIMPDIFETVGWVDDRQIDTPRTSRVIAEFYNEFRQMSLEEALEYPDLDAALIEVPNLELVKYGRMFAEKGIPIHLDKPAGETMEPYAELLELCKKKNVPLQMGYMYRGNPALNFMKTLIQNKVIGEVFQADLDMNHGYGGESYQEYIGKFKGGIMWNLGCHLIDFIVAAMGAPEAVTSIMKSAPGDPDRIKNNCTAILEYPHASVAIRACSRSINDVKHRRWFFSGTNGLIEVTPPERFDGRSVEIRMHLKEGAGSFPQGESIFRFPPQTDRYFEQLKEFAAIIRGEMKNPYTYEHDALVHKVTLAASGYINWK